MNLRLLKVDTEGVIGVGSVVKFKLNRTRHVGEVFSVRSGKDPKIEVIMYDKRLRPQIKGQGSFHIRTIRQSACKLIDENFKFKRSDDYAIGDVVMLKRRASTKYGVIIGFHHPDGLSSTSHENGYNGTDMIDCVEIDKRGLRRKRTLTGDIKRFESTPDKLTICEVDLWNRTGPKIITR